jgi:hypothetical protein
MTKCRSLVHQKRKEIMSVTSLNEWREKQAQLSRSKSTSTPNINWEELGVTHTEFEENLDQMTAVWIVLDRAWRSPFKIKSNFARESAMFVGICASEGLITTALEQDVWGDRWGITEDGRDFKEGIDERIRQIITQ